MGKSRAELMAFTTKILLLCLCYGISVSSCTFLRGDEDTIFRPPAIPIITFAPMHQKFLLNDNPSVGSQLTTYWDGNIMDMNVLLVAMTNDLGQTLASFQLLGSNWGNANATYAFSVGYPKVDPLTTTFSYSLPVLNQNVSVDLSFVHTLFAEDEKLLSRPIAYAVVKVAYPPGGALANVNFQVYMDMSSQNCVGLLDSENITWSAKKTVKTSSVRMGSVKQQVLQGSGDDYMLNWGYMYLAAPLTNTGEQSVSAGNGPEMRQRFALKGTLPEIDPNVPVPALLGIPVIAVVSTITATVPSTHFIVGYDEISVQYYFGDVMNGRWKTDYGCSDFYCLLDIAEGDFMTLRPRVQQFDDSLMTKLTATINPRYAKVAALAYRQTLAAIELTYSPKYNQNWAFLKEISSDGDINTMDVIFPASPLFLYFNPTLVKQLLLPVLYYGNNETWNPYTLPFSPHQLGTYPVANDTTTDQEIMPSENTGNMFLMLLGYMKETNNTDPFFYPKFWPLLTSWADYMVQTQLPIPPKQTCTDDFAGPLDQNTNLAAKGMIALYAYADLCDLVKEENCQTYRDLARAYAEYWVDYAIEYDPVSGINRSKLAYNQPHTWSTKYNFLWQKLLKMDGPFQEYDDLAFREVSYYKTQFNRFGFPMDVRHTYQKLDWMTWGSLLTNETSTFSYLFDGVFRMANETTSRWPLTDLYDTVTSEIYLMFRSRPVVGAVFAAMMVFG